MKRLAILLLISFFIPPLTSFSQNKKMQPKELTMLSLGDSYTIGESVEEADRFPNQIILQLHSTGIFFEKPRIIAKTGWTTDELMSAIQENNINNTYNFVTLLVGVNNQYRGRDLENYRKEFSELVDLAIKFSGARANHVIILSIPDWGITPFAEGRDRKKIAAEIDQFNAVAKDEAAKRNMHYVDITGFIRMHSDWIAADGLHPDARQYSLWAKEVATIIETEVTAGK